MSTAETAEALKVREAIAYSHTLPRGAPTQDYPLVAWCDALVTGPTLTNVNDFRAMGYTASALANYMTLLGWSPTVQRTEGLRDVMEDILEKGLERGLILDATIAESVEQSKSFWKIREVFGETPTETLRRRRGPRNRGCRALRGVRRLLFPRLCGLAEGGDHAGRIADARRLGGPRPRLRDPRVRPPLLGTRHDQQPHLRGGLGVTMNSHSGGPPEMVGWLGNPHCFQSLPNEQRL